MNAINTSRQQLDGFQRDFDALRQEVARSSLDSLA